MFSVDDFTIIEILQKASEYGYDESYVYIVIDLLNKLGARPWEPNENVLTIEKVKLLQ